jgi:DNA-binding NarL/FixJ family response regulator
MEASMNNQIQDAIRDRFALPIRRALVRDPSRVERFRLNTLEYLRLVAAGEKPSQLQEDYARLAAAYHVHCVRGRDEATRGPVILSAAAMRAEEYKPGDKAAIVALLKWGANAADSGTLAFPSSLYRWIDHARPETLERLEDALARVRADLRPRLRKAKRERTKRKRTRKVVTRAPRPLTPRQQEVYDRYIANSGNASATGRDLGIDRKTVDECVAAVHKKLKLAGAVSRSVQAQALPRDRRGSYVV